MEKSTKLAQRYLIYCCTLLLGGICITGCEAQKEISNTRELIQEMKRKHDGKWFQNFTFKQLTVNKDKNEVVTDSAMWYESVSYPKNFRIDRDIENNNYTIYRNDSTYSFRKDTLFMARDKPSTHLLFKGGLYFMDEDEVLSTLTKYQYDIESFQKNTFKGEPAYVVGNEKNQFWVHATEFYCMRRIYHTSRDQKVDVVYDNFKRLGKGWVEQEVTFYVDGVERMNEYYQEIKLKDSFDPRIYDLKKNYKWYLNY